MRKTWTEEEINILKDKYSSTSNVELSQQLNRGVSAICAKASKLSLTKDNFWTEEENQYLIENYSDISNKELSKLMGRGVKSVEQKGKKLNLKKSKELRSKQIGLRNKMVGRDLNYDLVKEIASKYKTRGEFQREDSSAYTSARINGWLDEICTHMIKISYSIPQLILGEICKKFIGKIDYDTRKVIKPYELDIYIHDYKLAFEYDGKGWHNSDKDKERDKKKNQLCVDNDITLIRIVENNRRYEEDVKKQFINNLELINGVTNKNIQKEDVLGFTDIQYTDGLLDDSSIKDVISKYTHYHDFITTEVKLYQKLRRLGKIEYYTNDLIKSNITWDINKATEEIDKYEYITDFITSSSKCYSYIKRNKLEHLISHLKYRDSLWNLHKIKKIINRGVYTHITHFYHEYRGAEKYIKRNGIQQEIKSYIKSKNV